MSWIDPEDAEYFARIEEKYLAWCERKGVEPYICRVPQCGRHLPCRRHPPEIWDEESV